MTECHHASPLTAIRVRPRLAAPPRADSYNYEEPALYGLIFLLFFFNGSGPLSVDAAIYSAISDDDDGE